MTWRDLLALPFYIVGAVLWVISVGPLFIGDAVSGKRHSQNLLRL